MVLDCRDAGSSVRIIVLHARAIPMNAGGIYLKNVNEC